MTNEISMNPTAPHYHSPVIRASSVRDGGSSDRVAIGPEHTKRQPSIKVDKTDGVVNRIEITCSCGEKIQIDLQYQ